MIRKAPLFFLSILLVTLTASAQNSSTTNIDRCGTMQLLEQKIKDNPELGRKFEKERVEFNQAVREGKYKLTNKLATMRGEDEGTVYTIPVVFHIVLSNPNIVTDAQIQAQLDTLNRAFSGSNGDSLKIPARFKSLFGKSRIQFCLAERTPDGESTTGIERITTSQGIFADEKVKYSSSRGANVWNVDKYFNVWICNLGDNVLGNSTFPNKTIAEEQGVVISYRSLPGASSTIYNTGKTLVHETGHYFDLFHIFGKSIGGCSDSDDVDDTPTQSSPTYGCFTGVKTDNCTPSGNGIMYQNFMDYTDDACMVMFTKQQVMRMEAALVAFRSSLLTSDGCIPPVFRNLDAQVQAINQPEQRICSNSFTPSITIRNKGIQTLTSLNISTKIDNGVITNYNWTGLLAKSAITSVTLNNLTTTAGKHVLTVYVSSPNNSQDEDATSDTLNFTFQYYPPITSVSESFESTTFPTAWDVVNPDKSVTWKRITGVGKTGNASVMIDNLNYSATRNKDDLRLPNLTIPNVDSAYLSFNVAAATYTSINTPGNEWDTLEVLISTNCGQSYTSLYKKWGSSLVTRTTPATSFYVPAQNEWRKDSLNLAEYINRENVLIAIRNTGGNENSIYLDDINFRTVTVNPNLKSKGILVTPSPTNDVVSVQFYPPPTNLRAIQVYSVTGQKVAEILVNGPGGNNYRLNLSSSPSGTYIVRVVYSDRIVTRKILKL